MSPKERTDLVASLRKWAAEYSKIAGRSPGVAKLVQDLLDAADELELDS
jgi:hypothetical protein